MFIAIGSIVSLFFGAVVDCAFAEDTRYVVDAAGQRVGIRDASRIVSIGGAVTEVLFALGLADRIVAVDQTSTYPDAAKEKTNVGYMRALSPEGVLSLAPSLIIAIEGSGPPSTLKVLRDTSIPFVEVPEARDPEGVARKIRFLAEVTGVPERGERLAQIVLSDFATHAELRHQIRQHRKALFALAVGNGATVVGGRDTSAHAILGLAGIVNAAAAISGFKPASDEAIISAAPDAIVIMSERGHRLDPNTLFALPAFAATPAAKMRTLIALPGLYLLGFGPRTAHAARDLAAAIYPELSLPKLPVRPWTTGSTETP